MTAPAPVRRLTADEVPLWRELLLAAIRRAPEHFLTTLEEQEALPQSWFVNELARRAVFLAPPDLGIIEVACTGPVAKITSLSVTPEARGRGLGSALLSQALDEARAEGAREAVIGVFEENAAALRLYLRHGFAVAERRPLGDRTDCTLRRPLP